MNQKVVPTMNTVTIIITMTETPNAQNAMAQFRLWQLISPALPVGAYAYSQGLETAVEEGWVTDESSAAEWISGILVNSLIRADIPIFVRLYDAWQEDDLKAVNDWNAIMLAMRESAELQQEDRQLGRALARLLIDLGCEKAALNRLCCAFVTQFSLAAVNWQIPLVDAARGYLWAWCENQVAAAVKLVPLGQTSGQRLLGRLMLVISEHLDAGLKLNDDEIGGVLPGLVMASAWHETQYSRLFRS